MNTLLETSKLTVGYLAKSHRLIAERLNLKLYSGELVCLLGANGSGKSTLLRTLAGMQPALRGSIRLLGTNLDEVSPQQRARQLSVVLTGHTDVGALTAYALVALGRYPHTDWSGRLTAPDHVHIEDAMGVIGIDSLATRRVDELSDGERQKVMIARALAQDPTVMLLDEPTAFLDLPRRVEIIRFLRQLANSGKRAILLSTHDLDLALRSADRLWLLAPGGSLLNGAPEDLVLNGALEKTFQGKDMEFDSFSGTFRLQARTIAKVRLVGEGLAARWTARALERQGYQVDDSAEGRLSIEVLANDHCTRWRIKHGKVQQECQNLLEMTACLRNLCGQNEERS